MSPPRVRETFLEDVRLRRRSYGHDLSDAAVAPVERHLRELLRGAVPIIRMHEDAFEQLLRTNAYLTQHASVIETSGGLYDPAHRGCIETTVWEVDEPSASEPAYGYLTDHGRDDVDEPMRRYLRTAHGIVRLILHGEVLDRSTVTFGDSLEALERREVAPSPATAVSVLSCPRWEHPLQRERIGKGRDPMGYVELQIFGGVSVADVSKAVADRDLGDDCVRALQDVGFTMDADLTYSAPPGSTRFTYR